VLLCKQVSIATIAATTTRCRNDEIQRFIEETHTMKRKSLINLISYEKRGFKKDFIFIFIFNCVCACACIQVTYRPVWFGFMSA
jgi:predicted metal-binding protein